MGFFTFRSRTPSSATASQRRSETSKSGSSAKDSRPTSAGKYPMRTVVEVASNRDDITINRYECGCLVPHDDDIAISLNNIKDATWLQKMSSCAKCLLLTHRDHDERVAWYKKTKEQATQGMVTKKTVDSFLVNGLSEDEWLWVQAEKFFVHGRVWEFVEERR